MLEFINRFEKLVYILLITFLVIVLVFAIGADVLVPLDHPDYSPDIRPEQSQNCPRLSVAFYSCLSRWNCWTR